MEDQRHLLQMTAMNEITHWHLCYKNRKISYKNKEFLRSIRWLFHLLFYFYRNCTCQKAYWEPTVSTINKVHVMMMMIKKKNLTQNSIISCCQRFLFNRDLECWWTDDWGIIGKGECKTLSLIHERTCNCIVIWKTETIILYFSAGPSTANHTGTCVYLKINPDNWKILSKHLLKFYSCLHQLSSHCAQIFLVDFKSARRIGVHSQSGCLSIQMTYFRSKKGKILAQSFKTLVFL